MPFAPLKSGDNIALVCTGTTCESPREPELCREYLQQHYSFNAHYKSDTSCSLLPALRAEILLNYLEDPSIKAIWSVRGGEGTADIIPYLDVHARKIKTLTPKPLIGFSDFTALLVYFKQRFNWPTLHAHGARQMPLRLVNPESEKITLEWLTAKRNQIEITGLIPLNAAAYVFPQIQGDVIGGNLTLLHISLKDLWELNPRGKIILLEEVNEKPYRVARTLKYMQRIGFLEGAKAIIFAGFNFSNDGFQNHASMLDVLTQFAQESSVPVLFTDQIGHGQYNYPVPFYADTTLALGKNPKLIFQL